MGARHQKAFCTDIPLDVRGATGSPSALSLCGCKSARYFTSVGFASAAAIGGAHRHYPRVGTAFGLCGSLFQWRHSVQHPVGQLHRSRWPRRTAPPRRVEEALFVDESDLRSYWPCCGVDRALYKLKIEKYQL